MWFGIEHILIVQCSLGLVLSTEVIEVSHFGRDPFNKSPAQVASSEDIVFSSLSARCSIYLGTVDAVKQEKCYD